MQARANTMRGPSHRVADVLASAVATAQADVARRLDGVSASYRAAERHRLSDSRSRNLRGVAGTADSHLRQSDRDELISRSRDADRNYPIARSLIEQHVDLIAGDGFVPKPDTGNDKVDRELAERWHEWAQRPEVTGRYDYDRLTEVAVRHVALDGGLLMVPTELGLAQMVGVQRLRSPAGAWDSLEWRGGIRLGQYGQPLEYNVVEWRSDGRGVKTIDGRRLAVTPNYESPFVLANTRTEDQYVGEPLLAPVLEDIGQLQDLMESVHQAAHMAALLAFVHKTMDPTGTVDMLGGEDQTQYNADGSSRVRSVADQGDAGVYTLRQGEELTAVQGAQPQQNYAEMIRLNIRLIGAAACLPLELAMLSFDQSNFHGALAAIEVAARRAERKQDALVADLHNRLYRWKVSEWAGTLPVESMSARDLFRVEWRYPRRLVVDPKREAEVFGMLHKMGAMPYRDFRSDWEAMLEQVAQEQQKVRELGIVIETTPGSEPIAGGVSDPGEATQPTPAAGRDSKPPNAQPADAVETIEAVEGVDKVQDTALNGAQVQSLQEILQAVSDGTQSPDVAVDLILVAFPSMAEDRVRRMVDAAQKFMNSRPSAGQGEPGQAVAVGAGGELA